MRTKTQAIIITVLVFVALVLVGLNSTRFFFRWDITRNRENSISEVSRKLFQDIDEQVVITYYVSDKLRNRAYQPQQIIDILNEYAAYSRGKIKVDVVDPVTEGVTQQAERLGVQPQQIQVIEQDQQSLAVVYSGIVIRYLDRYETIPVAFQTQTIEYDLTSSIRDMVQNESRTVGLLVGADGATLEENFQLLQQQLGSIYEISTVEPGDPIPPTIDALFVLGGDALTEEQIAPLDAYIMNGGAALFAIDGAQVDITRNLEAQTNEGSPVLSLLSHYGFTVEPQLVMNDQSLRIPITQMQGRMRIQTLEPYPHWIPIQERNINIDHPITARFSGLDLFWPSPVSVSDKENATTLVSSPEESWLMTQDFYTNPGQSYLFRAEAESTKGTYDLAVAYSGELDRYLNPEAIEEKDDDDGAPAPADNAAAGDEPADEPAEEQSNVPESTESARLLVIGDSDFLSNLINVTRSGYNLDFALNAADWLTNDEDLLSIRTRAARDVRLNAIPDQERFSRAARLVEVFNVVIVPALVVLAGVFQALRRRRLSRVN